MKILVVHRQKEVVNQIKMVLHENEPFIRFSDSGLDGLLAARVESFDLIICGTDLPVITGFEVVRSLRTASINRHTKVIFLSTQQDEETTQLMATLGAGVISVEEIPTRLKSIVGPVPQIKEPTLKLTPTAFRYS